MSFGVIAWDAATAYATTGSLSGALHAAAISWAGWELDDWMDTSEFFGPDDSWGNLAGKALSTTILIPLNNGDYGHTVKQVSSRETINQTHTCSAGCQMWNVIKNNWRSILFDTVEKTKEHSVHGKYLISIYDADSAVQGSVNIIDGEYLAGAVAMSGIVTRKIKIVDDVYKEVVNKGIWKSSRINAIKIEHIFSKKHLKNGIMDLGSSSTEILNKASDILTKFNNQNLLKEGSNIINTTMNGYHVTIRSTFKSGELQSLNIMKGHIVPTKGWDIIND